MKTVHHVRYWWEWALFGIRTPAGRGTIVAAWVHALLLLILAIWVLEQSPVVEQLTTLIFDAQPVELEFGLVESLPHETQDEQPPPQFVNISAMLPVPEREIPVPQLPAQQGSPGSAAVPGPMTGKGTGNGGKGSPKNAVTKGSFTAWTEPDDPEPGQDYTIVIEVKLPEKVQKYPLKDLSGIVIGTDGWRQPIPGTNQGLARVKEQKARLEFRVPGAPRLVRDTVQIRSRILKEEQTLDIVF